MASGLLQALLGAQYKPTESAFGIGANAIGASLPYLQNPYASSGKNIAYTAGAGLLAGLLGGMARNETNQRNMALMNTISQYDTASPEARAGLVNKNPRIAEYALSRRLEDAELRKQQALDAAKQQRAGLLEGFKAYAQANPSIAADPRSWERYIAQSKGDSEMGSPGSKFLGAFKEPAPAQPSQETKSPFQTINDMYVKEKQRGVNMGLSENEASKVAEASVAPLKKQQEESYKKVQEASDAAQKMSITIDSLESALQRVGDTGVYGPMKQSFSEIIADTAVAKDVFPGQSAKASAGKELKSLSSDIVKMSRQAGSGPMSDRDLQLYLSSAPNIENEPEANRAILNRYRYALQLQKEYVDFMQDQRSQGVLAEDAERLWQQEVAKNPYMIRGEDGNLRANTKAWGGVMSSGLDPELEAELKRRGLSR